VTAGASGSELLYSRGTNQEVKATRRLSASGPVMLLADKGRQLTWSSEAPLVPWGPGTSYTPKSSQLEGQLLDGSADGNASLQPQADANGRAAVPTTVTRSRTFSIYSRMTEKRKVRGSNPPLSTTSG